MKLDKLVGSVESVNTLLEQKLPIDVSYKLSVSIAKIQPELDAYNKSRKELVESLGVPMKDKNGRETGQFEFKGKKQQEFVEKHKTLLDQEVKVEILEIKLADLGKIEIEPKHLISLSWLIKE